MALLGHDQAHEAAPRATAGARTRNPVAVPPESSDAAAPPDASRTPVPELPSDRLAGTLARCVRERTAIPRPTTPMLQRIGSLVDETARLVAPTDHTGGQPQIERAYATFLARGRTGMHLGLGAAYVPNMYATFHARMLANGGQYWDNATAAFVPLATAFATHYAHAPVDGAVFSAEFNTGRQAGLGTAALTQLPGWQFNKDTAIGRELALFLGAGAVGVSPQFSAQTRAAVAAIHTTPAPAAHILTRPQPGPTLRALVETLAACPHPQVLLTLLDDIRGNAAAMPNGFSVAMGHLDDLSAAAAEVRRLIDGTLTNLVFGTAAGGLAGHFHKHVLGNRPVGTAAPHLVTAAAEAEDWMGRLGLAPNGLISRADLPNLAGGSADELAIFTAPVIPASRPADQAQTAALVAYLTSPAGQGDATLLTATHQGAYQTLVSNAFDAARAPGWRYLYFDGALKVAAHNGTIYMVAAWAPAAGTFRISTGFLPPGGSQAQYDSDVPLGMLTPV